MSRSIRFASALAVAFACGVAFLSVARAEDPVAGGGMPARQQNIENAFLKSLPGIWNGQSKAVWGDGKGTVVWETAVGGTAMLQRYSNTGAMGEFNGLQIVKVGDDGKAVTAWWLDSHSAAPEKFTGTLTDKGYEVEGDSGGQKTKMSLQKKGDGLEFKMWTNGQEAMTETFTRAEICPPTTGTPPATGK